MKSRKEDTKNSPKSLTTIQQSTLVTKLNCIIIILIIIMYFMYLYFEGLDPLLRYIYSDCDSASDPPLTNLISSELTSET